MTSGFSISPIILFGDCGNKFVGGTGYFPVIRITLGISTHDHICSEADVAFTMVIYRRSVLAPESDILVAESKTTLPLSLTNAIKTMKAKRRELKSGFLVGLHDSHGHLLKTD